MSRSAESLGWIGMTGNLARDSSRVLLLAVLATLCWLFGGVNACVQVFAFSALIGAVGAWVVAVLSQGTVPRLSCVAILLLVGIGVCLMQCVQLPAGAIRFLSPAAADLRIFLTGDITDVSTLSLSPISTRRATSLLIMGAVTFIISSQSFVRSADLRRLLWALAFNGAALAAFGLVQQLTWNGTVFWSIPTAGSPFASFVNKNNAACFLTMSLAAALGTIVDGRQASRTPTHLRNTIQQRLVSGIASLTAPKLLKLILAVCIATGIVATGSRGGIVSAVFAVIVVFAASRQSRALLVATSLVAVAILAVGLAQHTDTLAPARARLATLFSTSVFEEGRIRHWSDMLPAVGDFWLFGSGLGTYGDINRIYQRSFPGQMWFQHAENHYLETMVEGGIVNVGLLLACAVIVSLAVRRLFRPRRSSLGIAVCGCFTMASQVMHAFFDFGLQIPANFIAFAIVCGAVVGRDTHLTQTPEHRTRRRSRFVGRLHQIVVVCGVFVLSLLAFAELRFAQRAEQAQFDPMASLFGWTAPLSLGDSWELTHQLLEERPEDARLQLYAAEIHIERYRTLAAQQLRKELGDRVDEAVLDAATTLTYLHRRVNELKHAKADAELQRLRQQQTIQDDLLPAGAHALAARRSNPTLFRVHITLAALSFLRENSDDHVHLERARMISPTHPEVLFWSGVFDLNAGRHGPACTSLRRCLGATTKHLNAILAETHRVLPESVVIEEVLPGDPSLLVRLANTYYASDDRSTARQLLLERTRSLLSESPLKDAEHHHLAGSVESMLGRYERAIGHYRKAIHIAPTDARWRSELAKLLFAQSMLDEAREQAAWAFRLESDNIEHERLIREIINRQFRAVEKQSP